MRSSLRPSPLDRLLTQRPIRRLARSRISRKLRLTQRYDRQMRRVSNRELAAAGAAKFATSIPVAAPTSMVSADRLRTESPSAITTRFIVLTENRSGSTLLGEELHRRWPEIRSLGERFSNLDSSEFDDFESVARRTFLDDTGEEIVGCKIFSGHVSEPQLKALLQLEGMRVIILRRRNQLRRYVSLKIANKTAEWQVNKFRLKDQPLTVEKRSISIDRWDLIKGIITSSNRFQWFDRVTVGIPRIDVWYEDLSAHLDDELRRVATFLGAEAPAQEFPPRLKRQNPEPLRDLVTNFDEVSEFLEDIGLAEFLIEEELTVESTEVPTEDHRDSHGIDPDRWPDESQLHLLRALIGPEDSFEANWVASLATEPLWASSPGIAGMYPSIHHRMRMAPHLAMDLHDFRVESVRNTARVLGTLDALRGITGRCAEADLTVTLLGTTALLVMTSDRDSIGLRTLPVSGLDLTTRPEQIDHLRATLHDLGWATSAINSTLTSPEILERDGLELRLHRAMMRATTSDAGVDEELERDLRAGLVPAPSLSSTTTMPAPAELLLTIIVDGLFAEPAGSINWILDAHRLIADTRDDLDWERFVELTSTHRLETPVRAAITLLEDLTDLRFEDRWQ